jgi:transposase-like protein
MLAISFRLPLGLPLVEAMLAARGIEVTYEMVQRWALKFGQKGATRIRARRSWFGDNSFWMKWSSPTMERSVGCGALWISLVRA